MLLNQIHLSNDDTIVVSLKKVVKHDSFNDDTIVVSSNKVVKPNTLHDDIFVVSFTN
jgi:hypothetical protein